ncbi:MAG TPA: LuxR C-terminal-related transcriptional regulator [Propionicimonas sp.]|uniref:LuxR C-terminal-related transcriptional regulator n=1 Tax=Propionicimonas sp. TaxID=1955623 RepID=UPI002F3FFD34
MARPLLTTKLYVPRARPGRVERLRLLEHLDAGTAARLTLLSAPPGFGKTTLLAEWTRSGSGPLKGVAWVSLDAGDNDPGSFWAYVVAALEAVVPGLRAVGGELAATGQTPGPEAITTLLNGLADASGEVWLVLDDYHLVENREVTDGVRFLLENLPPQVHVLISTRVDPDLPLSRWRGRGELVELRAADLRFTRAEAAEYLREATGLELAAGDVDALGDRTEGWIAALQLAALSLRGRQDVTGFIQRFAGDDRYIVDYLMDEVLAHQPQDLREFLLRTAVLDRLSGPLCDAVTGVDGGSDTLARLDRANLFVVALDDQLVWFRYHHLFADVLRARLLAERPAEVPLLHRRASLWHGTNGSIDDAIRHALAAGDLDHAGELIEAALPEARRDRRDAAVIGWLRALPADTIGRSPVLTTFQGWAALVAGDLDAMEAHLDHAEDLLASVRPGSRPPWPVTDELRTLPATISMYRASLAQARGDLPGVVRHARGVLDAAGPDDHFWRGAASGFLALAAWSEGDITTAVEMFTTAVASLHSAGALVDALSSTALLAEMWTVAGRPDRASDLCHRALAAAEALGPGAARASADLHVVLAELDLDAGATQSADRHLAQAQPLADREPNSESRYRWFVAAARLAEAGGDHGTAITLLDEAEGHYRPGYYPIVRPITALRARVWIDSGDLVRAADWLAASGVTLSDQVDYLREYEHLTLVRLVLAANLPGTDRDEVIDLLHRLEAAAAGSGRGGSLVEIRELLAFLKDRSAVGESGVSAEQPTDALTERELQVLRLLDSELSGPEIARRLFVSHNTLRTHTRHIFTKLDVATRRAAVAQARARGLL